MEFSVHREFSSRDSYKINDSRFDDKLQDENSFQPS